MADQDTDGINELYAATLPVSNLDIVFVDFAFAGAEFGTLSSPFDTLIEGVGAANADATVNLEPGTTSETFAGPDAIGKVLELLNNDPSGGSVIIGQPGARHVQASGAEGGFISRNRVAE